MRFRKLRIAWSVACGIAWRLLMHRTFVAIFCIAACLASVGLAAEGPTPINKITGNVKAQLIAAKTSETRSQFLIARFKTVDEPAGREIEVHFRGGSATHDATLHNLVSSCVAGGKPLAGQPKTPLPANAWTACTLNDPKPRAVGLVAYNLA
jgi:hypothetical protein